MQRLRPTLWSRPTGAPGPLSWRLAPRLRSKGTVLGRTVGAGGLRPLGHPRPRRVGTALGLQRGRGQKRRVGVAGLGPRVARQAESEGESPELSRLSSHAPQLRLLARWVQRRINASMLGACCYLCCCACRCRHFLFWCPHGLPMRVLAMS